MRPTNRRPLLSVLLLAVVFAVAVWLRLSRQPAPIEQREPPPPVEAASPRSEASDVSGSPVPLLPKVDLQRDPELRAGALCGRVISAATAAPIAGAEVTFGSAHGAVSVRTDGQGAFCYAPEHPGTYQVAAVTAAGFAPFGPEWGKSPLSATSVPGVRVGELLIALIPSAALTVTVQNEEGAPTAGATVRLLSVRADEVSLFPGREGFTTDARGEARVQASAGAVLEAWHSKQGRGMAEVDAEALRAGALRISLLAARAAAPLASLAGKVLDAQGGPASGALVWARSAGRVYPRVYGAEEGYRTLADEEGRFAFEALEPGTYDVSAHQQGASPARDYDVPVPGPALTLRLSAGARLYGQVTDARGAPVVGFALSLQWQKGPLERLDVHESTVASPTGEYEVQGVAPGAYVLHVGSAAFAPHAQPVDVAPGAKEVQVNVRLQEGATLSGVVVSSDGRPLAGAEVTVEVGTLRSALTPEFDAVTGADGQFTLRGLPPTPVAVRASAPDHNARLVAGVLAGAPLRLELTRIAPDAGRRLEMVGIGAVLKGRGDALVVGQVIPGGGAERAGLVPGDEVVAVDGTPVTQLGFEASIAAVRGLEQSVVVLRVRKAGKPAQVDLQVQRGKVGA